MRLTCPNCGARYEVADTMVPPEGRDVQCSNCSTTWFQPGRRSDAVAPPPVSPSPAPAAVEDDGHVDAEAPAAVDVAEGAAEAADAPPEADPVDAAVGVAAGAQPQRRTLDPELRNILQEEAEREARLRRAEAETVETQSEMPLDQAPEDLHRARRRAELEEAHDAFDPAPQAAGGRGDGPSARDLFPDIDEINSTLRDTGDRAGDEADASDIDTLDTLPRRRRATRIGFFAVILIAAAGAALYANGERVATRLPALGPAVEGYVATVNGARLWLDDLVQGLAEDTPEG